MKSIHAIFYTSALWIIGGCLSIIYAFTHGEIEYQATYQAPAHEHHAVTAADVFSVVDGSK